MQTLTRRSIIAHQALLVLGGSLVLAISSQLAIPLLPVPITFQTMALLVLAIFLGPQTAMFATMAYLAEGAVGLPVFAEFSGGAHVLLGTNGGYLLAMPVAAYFAGWIAQSRSFVAIVLAGFCLAAIILTVGALFLGYFIGLPAALNFGVKPFILTEVVKVFAVAIGVSVSTRLHNKSN